MTNDIHLSIIFFFNDTATTEIYTLSLHDALPICRRAGGPDGTGFRHGAARGAGAPGRTFPSRQPAARRVHPAARRRRRPRSEEHTSELQSQSNLVCRLLLEKKNTKLTLLRIKRLR